jgi:hypothetical protein
VILFEVLSQISSKEYAMTALPSIDLPAWMAEQLSQASPDLLRTMLQAFAEALMPTPVDQRVVGQYKYWRSENSRCR